MYWGHHFWGMHLFWWIFWLFAIAALFVWALQRAGASSARDSAIEELRRQYAAGKIDEDEFRHRREILDRDRRGDDRVTDDREIANPARDA